MTYKLPKLEPKTAMLITTTGSEFIHKVTDQSSAMSFTRSALGTALDFVAVGRAADPPNDIIMVVRDDGYETRIVQHGPNSIELMPVKAKFPINKKATDLYLAICVPGTTHQIVGDVVLIHADE